MGDEESQTAMPEDVFTMYEARGYLGSNGTRAGRSTLWRYMLSGDLPFHLTSEGRYLFLRRDLDAIRPKLDANRTRFRSEEGSVKRRKKPEGETDAG